jgi:small subunit ribosomal protein S8
VRPSTWFSSKIRSLSDLFPCPGAAGGHPRRHKVELVGDIMSMTDPVADFLTRIRNAVLARHAEAVAPASKLKERLAEVLRDEGFIAGFDVTTAETGMKNLVVRLRWADSRTNAITGLRRRSRPGQRVYVPKTTIPKVRSGLGIAILSTSRGLMTDRAARKAGVGGEILCEVW